MSDDDELRALRARAYGRDADIGGDPAAFARLRELEARVAPVRGVPVVAVTPSSPAVPVSPPVAPVSSPVAPVSSPVADAETDAPPGELPHTADRPHDAVESEAETSTASGLRTLFAPRPSAPWLWLGAACVALASVFSVAATLALRPGDPRLVAEIAVDPDASWPDSFGETGPDFALFEEFAGLTIVRGLEWLPTDDSDGSCIVAIDTTELLNDSGGFQIAGWACEAGSFPATLRFEVTSSQPQELRDRFGDGAGIEMIMRGDRIQVFADR